MPDAGGVLELTPQQGTARPADNDSDNSSSAGSVVSVEGTNLIIVSSPFSWQAKLLTFTEGNVMTLIMTFLTLLALFMDDLRLWVFPKGADTAFVVLTVIVFAMFLIEFAILSCLKKDYLFSFFFWLDFVAALSLIPDMPFIWDPIVGDSSGSDTTTDNLTLARAARASRAGSRIARIFRFVRLIRLVRIAKLSELCLRGKTRVVPVIQRRRSSIAKPKAPTPTSKVGEHLSEKTTRRVVTMVLIMLFAVPALQEDVYDTTPMLGLKDLENLANTPSSVTQAQFDAAVESFKNYDAHPDGREWKVMFLEVKGDKFSVYFKDGDVGSYRKVELESVYISENALALLSNREASRTGALYNILLTIFVCFLLSVGALLFSKDANALVIAPIERMVGIIEKLRENPLPKKTYGLDASSTSGSLETGVLENTLEKLTGLLQVGFGEAGSTIIQKNINSDGELDPMVDGKRMLAIFGFCTIRNFQRINEVLGEDTLLFVNEIADLVHSEVHRLGGAANRNLGDSFLLVWRMPQLIPTEELQDLLQKHMDNPRDAHEIEDISPVQMMAVREAQRLANQALSAFIRVLCGIKANSGRFQKFNNHAKLREAIPDFQVSMGCGLHLGWAIEGAIGSKYKIDASYLSPHVNTCARLMAASRQYNVQLLMSESFASVLSSTARHRCRLIDRAAVKGSKEPRRLYTFDINHSMVKKGDLTSRKTAGVISMQRSDIERRRVEFKATAANSVLADFERDALLVALRGSTPKEFRRLYEKGVDAYLEGRWQEAEEHLSSAMRFKPDDGPAQTLLTFMARHDNKAPEDWKGYRTLTSK